METLPTRRAIAATREASELGSDSTEVMRAGSLRVRIGSTEPGVPSGASASRRLLREERA
jgi:hypothetical protein